jgi:carboxyl-terminal processing protease
MQEMSNEPVTTKPKRQVSLLLTVLITVFVAIVAFVAGTRSTDIVASFQGKKSPSSLDFSSLQEVYDVLRTKFDGNIDPNKLIDGAKHGMVEAAGDPYTVYFNADEAKAFAGDLEGTFEGIGAELGKKTNQLIVVSTLDGSPAKASGLSGGDAIVKVNDESTSGWSIEKAVSKIRGKKGTTVKLTVIRGEEAPRDISITRSTITDPSVKSEITADNIGIMRISRFGESDTARLATQAAQDFKAKGVKGVVVDLRGNGGGYLVAAQEIASLWLKDKVVVTERTGGKITDTLRSSPDQAVLAGIPTVVLVDGGSASASEILAGALSDNGAAKLVGEQTFGKGSVQTIDDILSGGQLKVTIAKWYTPNGKNINKEGIKPDVVIAPTADDIAQQNDIQKSKALQMLSTGL